MLEETLVCIYLLLRNQLLYLFFIRLVMKYIISLNTLAAFTHSILAACSFSALGDLFAAIQVAVTGLGVWGKCQWTCCLILTHYLLPRRSCRTCSPSGWGRTAGCWCSCRWRSQSGPGPSSTGPQCWTGWTWPPALRGSPAHISQSHMRKSFVFLVSNIFSRFIVYMYKLVTIYA